VRHLLLDHVVVPLAGGECQAGAGGHGAALDRVAAGAGEREHVGLARLVGEVGPGGCPAEAAEPHVDRVDGPAADPFHDGVPGLLQGQAALDDVPGITIPRSR
jgi:hypothetical protein